MHTWDVAMALDPAARVAPDAVELLIDGLGEMAARTGRPSPTPAAIAVATSGPAREFTLDTGGVRLAPRDGGTATAASLDLTAEALLRLVYGRLDEPGLAPGEARAENVSLANLEAVFPGF